MMANERTREPEVRGGDASPKPPAPGAPGSHDPPLEGTAMNPKMPEAGPIPVMPEPAAAQKLPPGLRKLVATTPEKEWPKIRAFLIESEEAGELVDMLPDMTRVMKYCPARLMGMVGKRQITAEQLDRAYTQLHDSLHGVRQALYMLLHLAGLLESRPELGAPSLAPLAAPAPEPGAVPATPKPKPVLAT